MGVVGAVTDAEAAAYRAAGWWSDTTLSECVRRNAESTPDKPAYVDFTPGSAEDRLLTWSEFDYAATNLAHRLAALRVVPGTHVAMWHRDDTAIHVLLVAIERAGGVTVGLGARAGVREVAQILRTARPVVLISDVERLESAIQAAADADQSIRVVALGSDTLGIDTGRPRDVGVPPSSIGPDDAFLINSTSGTTGLPKCVVHNQNRWHYFHQKAVVNGELTSDDVFLPVIPTPYGFGIWTSHTTPIHLGATTVRIERFSATATCAAIEDRRATVLCCVSTQLAMIVADESCRAFDLGSLRIVFTGGEPLPYAQTARFEELTGATILQFYGSNETGMLSATSITDPLHRRLRTAGRIVPEMQVRLFDGERDVTASGHGQPACRGPALSLGYLGGTDHDKLYTKDGWMRMGDICELDSEGYLSLTGRTSDFILRGGKNISAVAVEEVVVTHPAVAVAAAVAMPDRLFGERVCVYLELKGGQGLDLPTLVEHMLALGASKELLPERLEVLDELPRSSGGKVAKGQLRELIRSEVGVET